MDLVYRREINSIGNNIANKTDTLTLHIVDRIESPQKGITHEPKVQPLSLVFLHGEHALVRLFCYRILNFFLKQVILGMQSKLYRVRIDVDGRKGRIIDTSALAVPSLQGLHEGSTLVMLTYTVDQYFELRRGYVIQ